MVSTLTCSAAFSACTSPRQTEEKRKEREKGRRGGGEGREEREEGRNVGKGKNRERRKGSERVHRLENHITTLHYSSRVSCQF